MMRNQPDVLYAISYFNITDKNNKLVDGDGSIKNIKAKVLVMAGGKNFIFPKSMQDATKEYLGDLVTVKEYAEAGHSCFEDYPEEVAKDLKDFVA
mmetsp:Transcript_36137/g.32525  ORF Transcript_36137/g.32525 Transcript_36137/m.32525 type:complete len:95 (+) Transcript_36137:103-387(+)